MASLIVQILQDLKDNQHSTVELLQSPWLVVTHLAEQTKESQGLFPTFLYNAWHSYRFVHKNDLSNPGCANLKKYIKISKKLNCWMMLSQKTKSHSSGDSRLARALLKLIIFHAWPTVSFHRRSEIKDWLGNSSNSRNPRRTPRYVPWRKKRNKGRGNTKQTINVESVINIAEASGSILSRRKICNGWPSRIASMACLCELGDIGEVVHWSEAGGIEGNTFMIFMWSQPQTETRGLILPSRPTYFSPGKHFKRIQNCLS